MQETKQNKVARLLQKELAEIFQSQTRQMRGVLVSVTRVRVSPDLSICTAYLSIFPSEKSKELLENITANAKTVRYELGQRVRNQLRIIPELRFFIDDSLDYIDHIDDLLKKILRRLPHAPFHGVCQLSRVHWERFKENNRQLFEL